MFRPILTLFLLLSSCASYRVPTEAFQEECPINCEDPVEINKNEALSHPLYQIIPRHRCQIQWYDLGHWTSWMLFGNDDDGIFGEEPTAMYQIEKRNTYKKALSWGTRNPLHNFCFYVIGSAQYCNSELTLIKATPHQLRLLEWSPKATTVFAGKGAGFYAAFHGGKPFVSLRLGWGRAGKSEFYLGWRCRGNFGIKCIPFTKWGKKPKLPFIKEEERCDPPLLNSDL